MTLRSIYNDTVYNDTGAGRVSLVVALVLSIFSMAGCSDSSNGPPPVVGPVTPLVDRAYYIRSEGMINDLRDVEQIVVTNRGGIPVHIGDIGRVQFGAPRSPCSSSSSSSSPS